MTTQATGLRSDVRFRDGNGLKQAVKKGVPMNTRHNYFPLEFHGDLAPLICYFFFFFLAAFFFVAMS